MVAHKNTDVRIDRAALRKVLTELPPVESADWCVACGAGSSAVKLDTPMELVQSAGRDFLESPENFQAILERIDPDSRSSWCIACGAGAGAAASDLSALSGDVPDTVIDALSEKLIGTIKMR